VELFRSVGDRGGEHAALSFLGLIHPEDPRVAGWLEDSLQYAEEIGDRSRQVAAVIPLAWHHYLRARFGGDRDIESARLWATRLEDRAAEVAGMEWRAHGVCIDVNLRRLAGMFAADDAERVREFLDDPNPRVAALAATTLFDLAITDAKGSGLPPPARFDSPDPVIGIAQLIAFEALVLGGRAAEPRSIVLQPGRDGQGWPSGKPLLTIGVATATVGLFPRDAAALGRWRPTARPMPSPGAPRTARRVAAPALRRPRCRCLP